MTTWLLARMRTRLSQLSTAVNQPLSPPVVCQPAQDAIFIVYTTIVSVCMKWYIVKLVYVSSSDYVWKCSAWRCVWRI